MIKKSLKIMCIGVLLSTGLIIQPVAVNGEANVELQIPTSLKVQQATLVTPDSFRLGIDDYVTGFLDTSVKKIVLLVNDETIRNGLVYSDGTFEVEAGDVINSADDKVEIVGLDRRNNELDRQTVTIEQSQVILTADDYTLFDEEIRGIAGNQMSVVSLMINDELIRSVNVNKDDTFIMPIESGEIIETEDFVEIVGSNSGKEVARITVPVNTLDLQVKFDPFHFENDSMITGKLSGKAHSKAKTVQLYVNRKRYNKSAVNADGTFSLNPERNITNVKDNVVVAVLNENNEELSRFQMNLYGQYGTVDWTWDEVSQTITFGEGEFPDTDGWYGSFYRIQMDSRVNDTIKRIVFTKPVAAAVDSSSLFQGMYALEAIEGLTYLDVSKTENMESMFHHVRYVKELDLSAFNTQNVTNMRSMFEGAMGVQHLDLTSFNTSKVTDMSHMFRHIEDSGGYSHLESLNLSSFDTGNVTDMSNMFWGLVSLSELDLSSFDTSKVTTMAQMFFDNRKLTSLNISSFDTSNVVDMSDMFNIGSNIKALDVSNFNTSNVTSMEGMFSNLEALETLDISGFDTSNVTTMRGMFGGASALKVLNVSNFNTSNVTSMNGMFLGLTALSVLDITGFDTMNVIDMDGMFYDLASVEALDVSSFNTERVSDMGSMFKGMKSLKALDVRHFDTKKVGYMDSMFAGCDSLTSLDVSSFDTSNVRSYYMKNIFNAANLDSLTLGEKSKFWETNLPEKAESPYTGRWLGPDNAAHDSSSSLMEGYDGSQPGTYVREVTAR
ncbi:BspA family leucine-rich repeat surface protein [Enterococcus sp. BWR-S5]|uniref:BspA family leucine-rich repeat surface protein n=1 Tax=Enterococcus sp. BWR-S5 TaxID=2787714 RepID=UPI001921486E|nr:BspA family leucine-rich repeat surface protein [Enterococcus sp. BWR-S5]MBL1227577.1 BspA family leucine-rich repeat surface protein [Enterococcus sp. BWR-S5]